MAGADPLTELCVADRLRVAAGVLDDASAGRVDRHKALVRVLHIISLAVRVLITEVYRAGQRCAFD